MALENVTTLVILKADGKILLAKDLFIHSEDGKNIVFLIIFL